MEVIPTNERGRPAAGLKTYGSPAGNKDDWFVSDDAGSSEQWSRQPKAADLPWCKVTHGEEQGRHR